VTIAAVPEQVGLARAFVAGVLGESYPHADVAVLLASELSDRHGTWSNDKSSCQMIMRSLNATTPTSLLPPVIDQRNSARGCNLKAV
jgi:hypothetical protein